MSVIVSNETCTVVNKHLKKKGPKLASLTSVLNGKKNLVKSNYNIPFFHCAKSIMIPWVSL